MRKTTLALGATVALGGLFSFSAAEAKQAPPAFTAYPSPGATHAGPTTQISFRGGAATALGAIVVTGARTGTHAGTLRAHSDGNGVSWLPAKRFSAGERVTVRTGRHIAGATGGDFSFTVGEPTTRAPRTTESPAIGRGTVQSYASRPDLAPPSVAVTTAKPGRATGLVFISPKAGRGQDGPMIINDAGQLVWFKPMSGKIAADFRTQTYDGKPVLTWWEGRLFVGDGTGEGVIYDSTYSPVARVRAANGFPFDLHEFTITPRGTALITVYQRDKQSFVAWGGKRDGRVVDSIVQEIDIKTGLVLFEWHSLGNVGLSESGVPAPKNKGGEWDYLHINAIAETADGNLLVSGRNTSGIYKISRATGKVLWRLGGTKSDFKLGPGVRFDWQHSVRELPDGTLVLYDNSAAPPKRKQSRALQIRLDLNARTATLVHAFAHPRNLLSASQGNVEQLSNGNTFVGFGSQRWFSEFSPSGELLFDGRLAKGNDTYRAFRFPWSGRPANTPRTAARAKAGQVTARASWNGATGVARWQLLAGATAGTLAPIADGPATGFETAVTGATTQPLVAMRALDAAGATLSTSPPVMPVAVG